MDLTGQVFTRLTVVAQDGRLGKRIAWKCICECGNITTVTATHLRSGHTKSCGCFQVDTVILNNTSHQLTRTRIYNNWCGMIQRCNNPNDPAYHLYGGRGIFVCDRWLKFEHFLSDMGEKPEDMSLDRIDVNGPYSYENCRWATDTEQANNKRNNHLITFRGKTQSIAMWARDIGVQTHTLKSRVYRGWGEEKALTTPTIPTGQHRVGISPGSLGSSFVALQPSL